ncbi:MAG: hypothetical protein RDV41_08110 [Planctomycetota bacterium]|nr:hypothetical protein [Planctomycetota bacterium]
MSATRRLARLLQTGGLTCVGPKHFPATEYLAPRGWARLIGAELGKPARSRDVGVLRVFIRRLERISERCGDRFKIGVYRRSFIRLAADAESASRAGGMSRGLEELIVRILTTEGDSARQSRIKKMPQLDNVLRFLRAVLRSAK